MKLNINRAIKTPFYLQMATQIKRKIICGELMDGYALPSERILAKDLNIHRNTVVRAYNELKADGLITAHQGVGYRITYARKTAKTSRKNVNWTNAVKEEYLELESPFDDLFTKSYSETAISFAGGLASRQVYDQKEIAECLAEILLSETTASYFYTPYQGDIELRKEIAKFLRTKGVLISQSQVQIFSENNQALDFLITVLLSPGDTVFTEETVSPDVYRAIKLAGGEIIAIPMDKDGMITHNLYALIEKHKPKFIYVNSGYHNPTGRLLSLERRRELLEISYQYRLPIIEEDEASELYYEKRSLPSIKSMDQGINVIYINSFSLTLAPGVGISFVVAPKCVIKSLRNLVSVRLITLDWTPQRLTCQFLKTGIFMERLETFRKEYKEKRDLMCGFLDEVKEELGLVYNKPGGGVYLWIRLPETVDVNLLETETEKCGVTFIPGEMFFPEKNPDGNYLRLNYSYPTADEIRKGMKILINSMLKIQKNSRL